MDLLVRCALLGAATGGRSLTPLAALALRHRSRYAAAVAAAALGELVADKLPGIPSRVAPAPLAARIVLGALSGAAYARGRGAGPALPAMLGAGGAAAASYAGAWWRAHATGVPAAVAEDAATLAVAYAATAGPRRPNGR
ncbi:hypothetical protein ACQP2F_23930 [Actinoplanes sp. CA-030573]|uniref:hypothetical protein n=1 Tax=Actinoplanes sp. CA-030573 TaxID=3239898 RepID=UPI003D92D7DA